jgi:hypothetical protein
MNRILRGLMSAAVESGVRAVEEDGWMSHLDNAALLELNSHLEEIAAMPWVRDLKQLVSGEMSKRELGEEAS